MKKYFLTIIFLILSLFMWAQDTIFYDNFSDNRNQWVEINTNTNYRKIKKGAYIFENKLKKGAFESRIAVLLPDSSDYEISMIFKKEKGPNDRANGLIWGSNGKERFSFVISGNGKFSIDKFEKGKWHDFYPWTIAKSIKKDTAYNKLSMKKAGDYYVFFINDQRIAQIKYQKPFGNQIGFYVSRQTQLKVSSVWLIKNPKQLFIPVKIFAETTDPSKKVKLSSHSSNSEQKQEFLKRINIYSQYLNLHSNSREARLYRAEAYANISEYQKAIDDYNQLLITGNNAIILSKRAQAYKELKQYYKAISDVQDAINLDSANIAFRVQLALLYLESKNYKQAEITANQLIIEFPQNADLYNLRGEIFTHQKKYSKAISDFQQALRINPAHTKAKLNLQRIKNKLSTGNPEINTFTELIKNNPTKASNYYYRGIEREKVYDYAGALDDFSQAIRLNIDNPEAYLKRASLYEKNNNLASALADYNKYLTKFPWNLDVINKRIQIYQKMNQLDKALPDLNKAIRMQPNNIAFYRKRATIFVQKKDFDNALFDLHKISSLDLTDNKADFEYGKIVLNHKNDKKTGCLKIQKAANKGNKEAKKYFEANCK